MFFKSASKKKGGKESYRGLNKKSTWSGVLIALPEDRGSDLSTYTGGSVTKNSDTLSSPLWAPEHIYK